MFIFFLIIVLLIPTTMVGFGLLWQKNPPKKINSVYGYKTTWSMKSKKSWDFAHKYAGKIWIFTGIPMGIISVLVLYNFKNYNIDALGEIVVIITIVQVVGLFSPIIPTEFALRKRFNEKGKEKN